MYRVINSEPTVCIRLKDLFEKKKKTPSREEFFENARARVENAVRTIYGIAIPACSDIVRNYSGVSTDRRDTMGHGGDYFQGEARGDA